MRERAALGRIAGFAANGLAHHGCCRPVRIRHVGRGDMCGPFVLLRERIMTEKLEPGCRRPIQKRRVPASGWTKAKRELFLATLAGTCNVRKAAEAAGMTPSGVYQLRKRDPAFGDLWAEALGLGYERLEIAVLEHALIGVNAIDIGEAIEAAEGADGVGTPEPDLVTPGALQLAMALLTKHRQTVDGKPVTKRGQRPTPEETDAALKKQLDALERKLRGSGQRS